MRKNNAEGIYFTENIDDLNFSGLKFEVIEDEINIDNIENLLKIEQYEADKTDIVINRNKINELVQEVKQLNKEIKELKEKN